MNETNTESPVPENQVACVKRGVFAPVAAIVLLLAAGVSVWACYVWITSEGDFDFRRFSLQGQQKIEFYPVTGEVWFNGELIRHGHVEAHPVSKGYSPERVLGAIREDGTFELYSDYRGGLVLGAAAGEYKLLLMVHHPATGFGYPAKLLPTKYYDVAETPITIRVSPGPDKNHIVVKESGELNPNSEVTTTLDDGTEKK